MKSTQQVINIVKYLVCENDPKGVTEVCKCLGCSKTSTYRVLSTLKEAQWVIQDPETKKYGISIGLQVLGAAIVSNLNLRNASLPYLKSINETTGETTSISALVGLERMYVEKYESENHELRQIVEIGKRYPLWKGAAGKVILAYLEPKQISEVLQNLVKSGKHFLASGQVFEVEDLKRDLSQIRKDGYRTSVGERAQGVAAVAAPIFGRYNQVVGAFSVGGPVMRFTEDMALKYAPLVVKAAQEISLKLGYIPEKVL
jgi:IclR family transcriptional regulator, acetate operon repressor